MEKSIFVRYLTAFFLFFIFLSSHAIEKSKTVNILTWSGYLDNSKKDIQEIEEKCDAHITYDDYSSNAQFINRLKNGISSYQILIFSESVYDSVKNLIKSENSDLYLQSINYSKNIKKLYEYSRFPHNIVYFSLSLTGFLYNPNIISIQENESVQSIFKSAKTNIVVMIDDPVEANFLMNLLINDNKNKNINKNNISLNWTNFKKVFQNSHVIITNNPDHIVTLPNFAFAFQWSGDAINQIENNNKKLKFIVQPNLSYISADLLAELDSNSRTECVSKGLSSNKFLKNLHKKIFYVSPYDDCLQSNNKYFLKTCHLIIDNPSSLPKLTTLSSSSIDEIKKSWEYIDFKLNQELR